MTVGGSAISTPWNLYIERENRMKKVCVITGGGSGMGLAAAKLVCEAGYYTILVGRTASKLEKAAAACPPGISRKRGLSAARSFVICANLKSLLCDFCV